MGSLIGISIANNSGILIADLGANMRDIYVKPWTRIGPYIIGLVAGYLLYKFRKNETKLRWIFVLFMWALSAAAALAVVYGLSDYYSDGTRPSKTANVIYLTYSR